MEIKALENGFSVHLKDEEFEHFDDIISQYMDNSFKGEETCGADKLAMEIQDQIQNFQHDSNEEKPEESRKYQNPITKEYER